MTLSKIIQSLCDLAEDENIFEEEEYKKQNEEAIKWYKLLEKYINADKKLYQIYNQYETAEGLREAKANNIYFREGFLRGARLALEICGFELFDSKRG